MLKNISRILDLDPHADDLQNLISFSYSTDTALLNFHEDPISSFHVKLLTE